MTRPSFKLGDVITGEPHLYVANPPAPPADTAAEPPPASELKNTNPFRRALARCMFVFGSTRDDALAAALDKAPRP